MEREREREREREKERKRERGGVIGKLTFVYIFYLLVKAHSKF